MSASSRRGSSANLRRHAVALAVVSAAIGAASSASAQGAPPPPPAAPPPAAPPQVVVAPPGQPGDTYVVVQPPMVMQQPGAPAPYYAPPAGYAPPPGYTPGLDPGLGTLGPKYLDYEEGDPIPAGYHKKTRARVGLIAGGASMFGVSYFLSIITAGFGQLISNAAEDGKDYGPMLIPVVGPFVAIPTTHASPGGAFGLTFLGLTQAGGVAMFIAGFAAPSTRLVRNDIAAPKKSFTIQPTVGLGGLGAAGTF